MTQFNDISPTVGNVGNSFEWLWDITANPTNVSPSWLNVPDITGMQPQSSPKYKDGTTYANKGQTSQTKAGEDFNIQVQVKGVRDGSGEFQPELVALINAADGNGVSNIVGYRYYHATSGVLAYQGTAAVSWTRANTGNDDLEFFSFTLTGQGDRVKITNPSAGPKVPFIMSALPAAAAATKQVVLHGSNLGTVTGITIGGVAATNLVVLGTDGIMFTVPAGSAGSAPIIATNPAGAGAAYPYARGA